MDEYTKIQEMAEEIKKLREEIATETVQFQWFDLFKRAAAAILIFIIGMYIIRFLRKLFHNFLIKKIQAMGSDILRMSPLKSVFILSCSQQSPRCWGLKRHRLLL